MVYWTQRRRRSALRGRELAPDLSWARGAEDIEVDLPIRVIVADIERVLLSIKSAYDYEPISQVQDVG